MMSRSGYSDDVDGPEVNLGRGRRGQAFLRDLLTALDAMPEKRLIADELEQGGEVCAIGSVGRLRGVDMAGLDPEDHQRIGEAFDIACSLVQEVEFVNDEDGAYWHATPEQRHGRVRRWVAQQIREGAKQCR